MNLKIGVIIGSTRPSRIGPIVADWFMSKLDKTKADFELIDLKVENLPFESDDKPPVLGEYNLESTKKWAEKIKSYDSFVFITPEYNNAPPASLKNAIDTVYNEWDKKPILFVGYGANGAISAIDQLVSITAKMGMVPIRKTIIGITKNWQSITPDGVNEEFVNGDVNKAVENLLWWTEQIKK